MNWRRPLAAVMVAASLAAGVTVPAQADTGSSFFRQTWVIKPTWWHNHDMWGWELGLTAPEAADLINRLEDVDSSGSLLGDLTEFIGKKVPGLNAWNLITSAGVFALKRCSDHGKNGVVISGFHEYEHKTVPEYLDHWVPTGRLREVTVEGDAVLWCSAQ